MASEAVWRLWGYKCPPNATTARIFTDQNVINYRIDPLVRHWKCYHLGLKCSDTAGHLENFPLVVLKTIAFCDILFIWYFYWSPATSYYLLGTLTPPEMQDGNVIASSASHNVNVCSTRSSKRRWWTELFPDWWGPSKPIALQCSMMPVDPKYRFSANSTKGKTLVLKFLKLRWF